MKLEIFQIVKPNFTSGPHHVIYEFACILCVLGVITFWVEMMGNRCIQFADKNFFPINAAASD